MSRLAPTVFLAACGGAGAAGESATACAEVAAHLVRLAERDNLAAADPGLAEGMRSEFGRQCEETPWSAGRRRCLVEARTQDATLRCPAR